MAVAEPIKIDGLSEFVRNLRKVDADKARMVRLACNAAADIIVGAAAPKVPKMSGRAAATLKARSTRTAVRVSAGGRRAPYYPWLDFGGAVGRQKSVRRQFVSDGRYIYPAYYEHGQEVYDALQGALLEVVRAAGIEVT